MCGHRGRRFLTRAKLRHGAPKVFGREKLDDHRWAYAVEAPTEMTSEIPELIGREAYLDGLAFEICGIVTKAPPTCIRKGKLIDLLVRAPAARKTKNYLVPRSMMP